MCHQAVRPTPPGQSQGTGDASAGPPQREAGADLAAERRDRTPGSDAAQEAPANPETSRTTEQQEGTEESTAEGACSIGHDDSPSDPHMKAVQGLRFSSSGDFVGFVSPVPSCSSGDSPSLCEPWDQHFPMDSPSEESSERQAGGDWVHSGAVESRTKGSSPLLSNADLRNKDDVEGRSDSERAELHAKLEGLTASSHAIVQQSDSNCENCEESNACLVTKLDLVISSESRNSIKRGKTDAPYENGTEEPLLEETPKSQVKKSGAPNTDGQTTAGNVTPTSWHTVDSVDGNYTDKVPEADSCCEYSATCSRTPIKPSNEHTEHLDNVDCLQIHYQIGELTDPDLDLEGLEEAKPTNPQVPWSSTGAIYSCTSKEE